MTMKLRLYANQMIKDSESPFTDFLGAYNMGVWGLSVSGKPPLQPGLLAAGSLLTKPPVFTIESPSNPKADNYVAYYDTPKLWGYGDNQLRMEKNLRSAVVNAVKELKLTIDQLASGKYTERVQTFLEARYGIEWDGNVERMLWRDVATKEKIQNKMNKVGAWSHLVKRWQTVISQSRQLVDITSLSPPFTGHEAQVAICKGIYDCLNNWLKAAKKSPQTAPFLMIRLLFGMTIANLAPANTAWKAFYSQLENTLRPLCSEISNLSVGRLPVVLLGSDMGKVPASFNHSKIVAGDGQYAIVGGHNMCEEVSSNRAPVIHDITCEVTGPAAKTANAFAGSLWLKAAENGRLYIYHFNWFKEKLDDLSRESAKKWAPKNWIYYGLGKQDEVRALLRDQFWYYPMQDLPVKAAISPPDGSVQAAAIMGIGRWGDTSVFNVKCTGGLQIGNEIPTQHACQYASDTLKRTMIRDEKNTVIAMSQQDLVNSGNFSVLQKSGHTICYEIAKRLRASPTGTAIRIVVSSRFTQNCDGLAYSYGDGPREAAERISDSLIGAPQVSSYRINLPARLKALRLSAKSGPVTIHQIRSKDDPSFCTIAPLAFCEARGTTRDRGSYVWPDVKFKMDPLYSRARFWNLKDQKERLFGPGNHSKVLYVSEGEDDATGLVLIGSDNMYPSPLSEFSFVIEGKAAVAEFRKRYWDRLWGYSARLGFTVLNNGTVV